MKKLIKKVRKALQKERGSEALQSLLLSGIALVLVILVFFPAAKGLIETTSNTVSNWWNTQNNDIFVDIPSNLV